MELAGPGRPQIAGRRIAPALCLSIARGRRSLGGVEDRPLRRPILHRSRAAAIP